MKKILISLPIAAAVLFLAIAPAMAAVTTTSQKIASLQAKANKEIDSRITALNNLSGRIDQMKRVSDADKAALKSGIQSVISTLNDLKAKIAGDTDLKTLQTDLQSITKAYRVYALVVPRANIAAASDRVNDVAGMINTVLQKLQTRISQLPAGTDTTSMQSSISDIIAKITDAQTQASAAVKEISALAPDNGDKNIMASNTQVLKDAHSKIQAAQKDLKDAENDIKTIIKEIRAAANPLPINPPPPNSLPATP